MNWTEFAEGIGSWFAVRASDFGNWMSGLFAPSQTDSWVSGLTGAFGAVLGSLVTIAWTEWFNKRSFQREQKERNSAALFGCLHRLNHIYSGSMKIRDHFTGGLTRAREARATGRIPYLTLHVIPMMRMSGPVEFPVEELWLASRAGRDRLLNAITALDDRFNGLNDTVQIYHDKRTAVVSMFPPPTSIDGAGAGDTGLTEDTFAPLRPGLFELDMILEQMEPIAIELVNDTFDALRELVHAENSPFRDDFKLALPDPAGNDVVLTSSESPHRGQRRKAKKRV